MTNIEIFQAYVQTCERLDLEGALEYYASDAAFDMTAMETVHGVDGIRQTLAGFFGSASEVRFEVHEIAESPSGAVLTERTDCFLINGVWARLPVMGLVTFKDGKITLWREYYDSRVMESEFAKVSGS